MTWSHVHWLPAPWGESSCCGSWEAYSPCVAFSECIQPHAEKQKLFWKGLENPMQFMPHIFPGHFIRDWHSICMGAAGMSSSPSQTPVVESPMAMLRKQRAHQLPALHAGAAACSAPAEHSILASWDASASSCRQEYGLHPRSLSWLCLPVPSPGTCTVTHPTQLFRSPGAGRRPSTLSPRAVCNEVWSLLPGAMCEPVTWL